MLKGFFAALVVFSGLSAYATQDYCGYVKCYDECTRNYSLMRGNRCEEAMDVDYGCRRAHATCDPVNPVPLVCRGVYCYSKCTHSTIFYPNAYRCVVSWDSVQACWISRGRCP